MNFENRLRPGVEVRRYRLGEEKALQEIYFQSTRILNGRDYTPEQIERWVAKHADLKEWIERVRERNSFVAIINERPVAFGELEADGHIDFFYCHPDWQGQGAGSALLHTITAEALKSGLEKLYAEVSVTAEPFFTRNGFEIVGVRIPIICGAPAKQFMVRKSIK